MESCQDIYKINTSKYNTVLSIRSNLELIERLNKYINSDICKTGVSGAVQTQILGFSSGITIKDENCEIIKLSRQLYAMGMKVAAVSLLSSDPRVFDSMWASGTFPPINSAIGLDAKEEWEKNPNLIPEGSMVKANLLKEEVVEIKEVKEGRHNDIKKYLLSGIALILLL